MCPKLKRFGLRSLVGKTGPLDREHPRGSAVRLPDGETIPCGWGARLVPGAPHLGGEERGTQMSPAPSHAVLSVWLHCLAPRLPHHKMQLTPSARALNSWAWNLPTTPSPCAPPHPRRGICNHPKVNERPERNQHENNVCSDSGTD